MRFSGLSKLTLLDFPGTVACTLFTAGCNFRCPYCHNASLVTGTNDEYVIPEDEIWTFLKKRQGIIEGVAITGGEPMLHKGLPDFFRQVRDLGYKIKCDTNGTNPAMLKQVVSEGLVDYIAMDIKDSPELYPIATGIDRPDMEAVTESKEFLLEGRCDYEFRTTVVKGIHTPESIRGAALWIKGARRYFLQGFKDSGELLKGEGLEAFTEEEMKALAGSIQDIIPAVEIRGY
ncbi:MAG: anaerobic ribonucleoside-triphosphate reductase activating protein [Parasporobacterium sp.]|nr:anaerobic ribonucleoside-triphosphate reductase activating protein [Parasporobacterium sp.]